MWTSISLWVVTLAAAGAYTWVAGRSIAAGGPTVLWVAGVLVL
jgi:hypothetical protein